MNASPDLFLEKITFDQAIQYTSQLLTTPELADEVLESKLVALLDTMNGARGFFVAYLTGSFPQSDAPSAPIYRAIAQAPTVAIDLLVKNIAMSTAMVLTHCQRGNEDLAKSSALVANRSSRLIRELSENYGAANLIAAAKDLRDSAEGRGGTYGDFLERWQYDEMQRLAIVTALESACPAIVPDFMA
ncbi:MAG: hypothetical protein WCO45_06865 [Pseudanabaena sp. ELA607]|jgi:hypothetical protein